MLFHSLTFLLLKPAYAVGGHGHICVNSCSSGSTAGEDGTAPHFARRDTGRDTLRASAFFLRSVTANATPPPWAMADDWSVISGPSLPDHWIPSLLLPFGRLPHFRPHTCTPTPGFLEGCRRAFTPGVHGKACGSLLPPPINLQSVSTLNVFKVQVPRGYHGCRGDTGKERHSGP